MLSLDGLIWRSEIESAARSLSSAPPELSPLLPHWAVSVSCTVKELHLFL